jgi:hypothetical protein
MDAIMRRMGGERERREKRSIAGRKWERVYSSIIPPLPSRDANTGTYEVVCLCVRHSK